MQLTNKRTDRRTNEQTNKTAIPGVLLISSNIIHLIQTPGRSIYTPPMGGGGPPSISAQILQRPFSPCFLPIWATPNGIIFRAKSAPSARWENTIFTKDLSQNGTLRIFFLRMGDGFVFQINCCHPSIYIDMAYSISEFYCSWFVCSFVRPFVCPLFLVHCSLFPVVYPIIDHCYQS